MIEIVFHNPADILERISWIGIILGAVATVGGVVFAGFQLVDVRRASQASLLLELDARFDSDELRGARNLLDSMISDINDIVTGKHPIANDQAKAEFVEEEWRDMLRDLKAKDHQAYLKLLGWVGFFETLGLMVKRKYISQKDAFDLFRGPLIDVDTKFRLHIEDRCKEMGVSKGLLEHALQLSAAAKATEKI